MYGITPQNSQVVFGQLLGMADYISLPLGTAANLLKPFKGKFNLHGLYKIQTSKKSKLLNFCGLKNSLEGFCLKSVSLELCMRRPLCDGLFFS